MTNEVPDYLREKLRVKAAGYAHIDRICVDGGAVVEPRPRRRRLISHGLVMLAAVLAGFGLVAVAWGIL